MEEQKENQNQEYRPQENTEATETTPTPEKKQTGSIIGSIIVIIVIIIGGLYFWGTRSTDPTDVIDTPPANPADEIPLQDPIGDALNRTSGSDELDDIEADLNATDINSVDGDVNSIE